MMNVVTNKRGLRINCTLSRPVPLFSSFFLLGPPLRLPLRGLRTGHRCLTTQPKVFWAEWWLRTVDNSAAISPWPSILDKLDIYASACKFSPLIAMDVHDMIRHVLTTLCFVHVSSILDELDIYASVCKFSPLIAMRSCVLCTSP